MSNNPFTNKFIAVKSDGQVAHGDQVNPEERERRAQAWDHHAGARTAGPGKSSLTKLLSGRFPKDKSVTIQGQVVYNGTSTAELHRRLPQFVAYVPQREKHYPELTVKEPLEFAHAACGGELSERDAW
ncbi:hypothetical protein PR001_g10724 [Phytophthora rubi]|uniref:ABC transporter domain-containing protein n=1 Tax=Phytophthora rubi TaxID=129364 RepID=A0A6A3MWA6_9STRA|nr:hypothetical protein PR001_g10724 [Phytophthora rubi]